MRAGDTESEIATEFRRILALDPMGTDFFAVPSSLGADERRRMTAWLRTLPSGLTEAELERRMHEKFGAPPA